MPAKMRQSGIYRLGRRTGRIQWSISGIETTANRESGGRGIQATINSGFLQIIAKLAAVLLNTFGAFGDLAGACYSMVLLVILLETIHVFWVTFRVGQDEL